MEIIIISVLTLKNNFLNKNHYVLHIYIHDISDQHIRDHKISSSEIREEVIKGTKLGNTQLIRLQYS